MFVPIPYQCYIKWVTIWYTFHTTFVSMVVPIWWVVKLGSVNPRTNWGEMGLHRFRRLPRVLASGPPARLLRQPPSLRPPRCFWLPRPPQNGSVIAPAPYLAGPPPIGHGPLDKECAFNMMVGLAIIHAIISPGRALRLMATVHLTQSVRSIWWSASPLFMRSSVLGGSSALWPRST